MAGTRELIYLASFALGAIVAGCSNVQAEGMDPAYDSFLGKKAYSVPTHVGMNVTGYTISTFTDKKQQAGAVTIGSVGVLPPPPDMANPRFNFIPQKDYGQGAGVNLRFGF